MKYFFTILCFFLTSTPMAHASLSGLQERIQVQENEVQELQSKIASTLQSIEKSKSGLSDSQKAIASMKPSNKYYETYQSNVAVYQKNLEILRHNLGVYESQLPGAKRKLQEAKKNLDLGKKYYDDPELYSCSPSTKTIDLEGTKEESGIDEKGVFSELPRDHQNGLGTCFANVAKNLLYGVSDGKANASFLDIALQYQDDDLVNIDGGTSCLALEKLSERGFCPKEYSPIENGDSSYVGGLLNSPSGLRKQSYLLRKIETFLKAKGELENKEDFISQTFVKNAPKLIAAFRNNPDLELPFPSLGKELLEEHKVREHFHWGMPKSIEISKEDYDQEWDETYRKYKEEFVRAIKKDDYKETIPKLSKKLLDPFFERYKIGKDSQKFVYNFDFSTFFNDFDRDKYLARLQTSEKVMAQLSGKDEFIMEEYLDPTCRPQGQKILELGKATNDLIAYIEKGGLDSSKLLRDGKLLSNKELLQLATAPKCAVEENRVPVPKFSCDFISPSTQQKEFKIPKADLVRFRTLTMLRKGLPVGNSFATVSSHHINTIVGFRYNPEKKDCEYKIRESQNATSTWQSEKMIADKIDHLTMADRE